MYDTHPEPRRMEVVGSIQLAIERTQEMCFRPFTINRWFALGVMAFLDLLLQGSGMGSSFNFGQNVAAPGGPGQQNPLRDVREGMSEVVPWIHDNLLLIVILGVLILIVGIGLFVLTYWLGARGQVMFARAVAENDDRIARLWDDTATPAWSLFMFRIGLALVVFPLYVALGGGVIWYLYHASFQQTLDIGNLLLALVPMILVMVVIGIAVLLVKSFTRSFVVPLMAYQGLSAIDGWKRFGTLCRGNAGPLLLFIVMKVVIALAIGVTSMIVFLLTCCLCMVGIIPIVGQFVLTVIMLPLYVFERSYTLHVLGSLGPDFDFVRPIHEPPPSNIVPGPGGFDDV